MLIPKLFDAIKLGNVKSECVLGDRIIGHRQVRLKLVAEVVDPGSNPLATHSQPSAQSNTNHRNTPAAQSRQGESIQTSKVSATKTIPRRGPRRKHPMSRE